ncbi:rhodanese-like domain-containing protein [Mycobacterium sp. 236(2023)]|uniref:rhodanese-like domain-containing protein n=1 Tax=Mycobacterium sp. 236(2023) TaxID=3038163 RepID=UPI0024158347|nr:rhodanese-like domain-containing protein [Mycobacterium sp. 236(2023)]MDG4667648.1 rhodanese-like domain-containing protein [Mycobacterium sp. 236(2023)]
MARPITGEELYSALLGDEQLAILDLRTPAERADGHIAVSAGLSLHDLEQRIADLVPHASTPIVVVGTPEWEARGAEVLERLGYRDVSTLDDGVGGWQSAGGRLYTGTNVRSKTLGEWIEHTYQTPTVESATLAGWLAAGDDVVILDSRTPAEYLHHHIPGGLNTGGGAEVTYRALQAITDPATKVVVNCQGRTRGIVGAQSLINTGIPNQVFSLHNGTPAWEWAGQPVEFGAGVDLAAPDEIEPSLREWAASTLQKAGVAIVDPAQAQAYVDEEVSTYVLDVRARDEYAAGHFAAAVHTPGGQLVQATDDFVAVRRSRVILVDTGDFVRAANTAQWLRFLHDGPISVIAYAAGADVIRPHQVVIAVPTERRVTWDEVTRWQSERSVRLVDVRSSARYAAGHVPGSVHARREHLGGLVADGSTVVLIGDKDFVADHLADSTDVWVLDGGIDSAVIALSTDDPQHAGPVVDRTGAPEFGPERDAWYVAYFEWELSLLSESKGDPFFDFDTVSAT